MPESDPLRILLAHDRWATEQLLETCGKLSAEQFHRRFEMGFGSLHDTITHMIAAKRTWIDTLVGRGPRPRLETDGQRRTPDELRALWQEACEELESESTRRPLDEITTRKLRDGRTVHLPRGAILTHVTTHGTHHRAQCLNMLRQSAVTPLPLNSVAEWTWVREGRRY